MNKLYVIRVTTDQNPSSKILYRQDKDLQFLIERGTAFNEHICFLDNIYSIHQWIDRVKRNYSERYFVEDNKGNMYWCEPVMLPKKED
jgi:hypothetical protein